MKLLFVIPYAPTLIRTRPYNLLRALARRGHQLTLATVWENEDERRGLAALAADGIEVITRALTKGQIVRNALATLPTPLPVQARYSWQPSLARHLLQEASAGAGLFDLIHVEHLRGAEYGRFLQTNLRQTGLSVPVIWDSVDCISLLFEQAAQHSRSRFGRWVTRFELPRTRWYEGTAVRSFTGVLATSPKDKAALEALTGAAGGQQKSQSMGKLAAAVEVLPNGVDIQYFAPLAQPKLTDQIVFTGKMSYHANITAALHLVNDIMPRVWQHRPSACVVVAGSSPPPEVRELARRFAPRVTVTGYVPDLRPYFHSAAVAAAPIRYGAGIQNKVLEAMACGVPVVASQQASSALLAKSERDLLVAESEQDFAQAILRLLESPTLRCQLGENGRRYTENHHDWGKLAARLEEFYDARRDSKSSKLRTATGGRL